MPFDSGCAPGRRPRRHRRASVPALALAGALTLLGATSGSSADDAPAPRDDRTYVIQISADGLRGDLLRDAVAAGGAGSSSDDAPNLRRLAAEGASTFNARTDFTHTNTLPNHTCMLTGRPVTCPEGWPAEAPHDWTRNSMPRSGENLQRNPARTAGYIASVFDVVHDAGLTTALYASKKKFVLFDESWNESHGAPDRQPPDDGRDKIDRYFMEPADDEGSAAPMQAALLADLASDPARYTFVHYVDLDAAGHDVGWGTSAWQAALRRLDGMVGEVRAAAERNPRLAGRTVLVVSADHGGSGEDHSDATLVEDYTIPFLVWGPGIASGADLYALNRETRADPGAGRPDYNAPLQPIRNGDAANLILQLFGLGPLPGSTINARQDLRIQAAPTADRTPVGANAAGR